MGVHWEDWCWSWNSRILATWCKKLTHLKRPWWWKRLKAGGEGDDRGWDGWRASPTRWTWAWVNSGSWWWTGRPGVMQFMGSQRVGYDWATELTDWLTTSSNSQKLYYIKLFHKGNMRGKNSSSPVSPIIFHLTRLWGLANKNTQIQRWPLGEAGKQHGWFSHVCANMTYNTQEGNQTLSKHRNEIIVKAHTSHTILTTV